MPQNHETKELAKRLAKENYLKNCKEQDKGDWGTSLLPVWLPATPTSLLCAWKIGTQVTVKISSRKNTFYEAVVMAYRDKLVLVVHIAPRHVKWERYILAEWVPISDCSDPKERTLEEWVTSNHDVLRTYFAKCLQLNTNMLTRSVEESARRLATNKEK